MAVDMLIDSAKEAACRTAEADAIREKRGTSATINYDFANSRGFAAAINLIRAGEPTQLGTPSEMEARLVAANVGKVYRYTGETNELYVNGDLYIVEAE